MKTPQLGSALVPIPIAAGSGGDVTGSLPGDLTVVAIQGVPVCVTAPSLNDVLTFDGTDWCPSPPAATGVDVTDGTITVTAATTLTTPAGGLTAISGTNAGLDFLTNARGGQGIVKAHGNFGATETIDLVDGNWHWGTLNADCTFAFTAVASTKDCEFWLELIEDGTGGWSPTWPGSVVFPGGTPVHDTTLGTTTIYGFITRDGGTTWVGGVFGSSVSGGTPALTFSTTNAAGSAGTAVLTDATIALFDVTVPEAIGTAATGNTGTAARRNHVHPTGAGTPTTQAFGDAATTGSGPAAAMTDHRHGMPSTAEVTALLGPQHAHVDNVTFSGDGATTVFILPVAPVDAYSIGVYVAGSRSQDWSLSGTLLDTLTFGSAPASATDNIVIDIAAAL